MAMNYSALAMETTQEKSWIRDAALVLGASVLIALFAPISIRLPFSPVPIAVQENVVFILACLLGSKRASLAVMTYLFQGAMGLPVFAGGAAGLHILAGPTGGYLFGYLAAAFATGYIMERAKERTLLTTFTAMGVGNALVFLCGIPWLALYIGWKSAIVLGLLPFVIGDALKLVFATRILKTLRRI